MRELRLAVLGSTRGSNLIPLSRKLKEKNIPFRIEAVISNRADAGILQRAREQECPALFLSAAGLEREAYDQHLSQHLQTLAVDLVILIGYMRILSTGFVEQWRHRILNVHPSLLPAFAGLMDKEVHQAVLDAGVSETGCTVHEVNEELDGGPVLIQKTCPVYADDTVDKLKARVQQLEADALSDAIQLIYQRNYHV